MIQRYIALLVVVVGLVGVAPIARAGSSDRVYIRVWPTTAMAPTDFLVRVIQLFQYAIERGEHSEVTAAGAPRGVVGDEDFLKARCREAIQKLVLGDADPEFALAVYPGDKLDLSVVRNDLETLPFLSPARLVVVEAADTFVTAHREALERYVAKPSSIGVLVLEVKTFPETTKLAKALPDGAKLVCKAPTADRLKGWCAAWCKSEYQKAIAGDAAFRKNLQRSA